MKTVLKHGIPHKNTLCLPNASFTWASEDVPLLSLRKVPVKPLFEELKWMLNGGRQLTENYASLAPIWGPWADKNGYIPTSYGRNIVNYPPSYAPYPGEARVAGSEPYVNNVGLNQLAYVIHELLTHPNSRRAIINLWNPHNATVSSQPPCLVSMHFQIINGELYLHSYHRSTDLALGFVFDIVHEFTIGIIVASMLKVKFKQLTFASSNLHIYDQHRHALKLMLKRPCNKPTPKLSVEGEWLLKGQHRFSHIEFGLADYKPHPYLKLPLLVSKPS